MNASGLRGPELPATDTAHSRRVAFVGDSFLVGEAVREAQLATSLTRDALRASGESVEVYNLSGIDTGTAQQLMMLREFGPKIRPTEVVLYVYAGNDLINNSIDLAGRSSVSAGDYIRPYMVYDGARPEWTYTHPARAWLRRHSRLYAEAERRLLGLGVDARYDWLAPWPIGLGTAERLRLAMAPSEDLEVLRSHDPGHRWERAWRTTAALLAAFRDECEALGARLLVVIVPSIHQVMRTAKGVRLDLAARLLTGQSIDRLLDWNLPERRFAKLGEALGIEVRALLPSLREAARNGRLPYGRDEHFAPSGHAVASQLALAWLRGEPAVAEPHGVRGRPVWLLPEGQESLPLLDFAAERHVLHLGDGWLRWAPRSGDQSWGWTAGPRAMVVVRATPGELVVRGEVPSGFGLPVRGYLEISGAARQAFELDRHGAFEVRLDPRAIAHRLETARGGYVAVEFAPGRVDFVAGELLGLLVHEIGFVDEPPAPPAG